MKTAPSGKQFEIRDGAERATIVEVGGGVREYLVGERPVLDPYPADAMCDGAHGAPLIPWPNRLADGRYQPSPCRAPILTSGLPGAWASRSSTRRSPTSIVTPTAAPGRT